MSSSKSLSALVAAWSSLILIALVMAGPFAMDVEWNLHSREGAPVTRWSELSESKPNPAPVLTAQALVATENVAEAAHV